MNRTQNQPDRTAPAVDISPATILRCAARYLELHGWIQGSHYADDTQPFPAACTVAAIHMACFGQTDPPMRYNRPEWSLFLRAQRVLTDHLDRTDAVHIPTRDLIVTVLHDWNDEADRDAADIIETLRTAADDYDWVHATEADIETYADECVWNEKHPTREGFLAWLGAR